MSAPMLPEENTPPRKLFLLGLLASVFAVNVIDVFAPLLYPEIAATFGITVGTAVQLSAFSSLAGVVTGLALSAFSIKFRYKTLLMVGVFSIAVCALGVFLAPNFLFAQIFYALNGVGSVIVGVMVPTLIGELYPLEKKAKRVSWVLATGTMAVLIGNPVTGFIANSGGVTSWRSALLWFMLPAVSISLMLVVLLVPTKPMFKPISFKKVPFLNGYKEVFTNRSTRACLTNTFFGGIYVAVNVFASSFLSNVFAITPAQRSLVVVAGTSRASDCRRVNRRFPSEPSRTKTAYVGNCNPGSHILGLWLSTFHLHPERVGCPYGFRFAATFIGGFTIVAGSNLYLEQVPNFRGTMMSLTSAFNGLGATIGVLIGGTLLNIINNPVLGYPVAMVTLGALGLIGTLNIILFAKDPVKKPSP